MSEALPQEMQQHTYAIMRKVEDTHWWFAGRRRILKGLLHQIVSESASARPRILDVGCGTGANLELLGEFGDAEGVDVSPEALSFCQDRGLKKVHLGAAEKLPFEDKSFDIVTALDVIEHLDDDVAGYGAYRTTSATTAGAIPLRRLRARSAAPGSRSSGAPMRT
jgi:SAM-dependent methyltransferase